MFRDNYLQWRAYKAPDFHPRQQDAALSEQWLRNNTDKFTPVGQVTGQSRILMPVTD